MRTCLHTASMFVLTLLTPKIHRVNMAVYTKGYTAYYACYVLNLYKIPFMPQFMNHIILKFNFVGPMPTLFPYMFVNIVAVKNAKLVLNIMKIHELTKTKKTNPNPVLCTPVFDPPNVQ